MAFDARNEDWQRVGLRLAGTLDPGDPFGSARAIAGFGRRFSQDHESLPQSDADRAFHLVAQATEALDYELPFATDAAEADRLSAKAGQLLLRARDIDKDCADAARMLQTMKNPSFEALYRFLANGEAEVRRDCERARDEVDATSPEERRLARELAFAPYLRWVAHEASSAMICGRYRKAVELSLRLERLDETGVTDAGLTLALAYAKLEDESALAALTRRGGGVMADAWLAMANLATLYHGRRMSEARELVDKILAKWPGAGLTLSRQDELPEGAFARIRVERESEDELILAVSEATVLLQEGRDDQGRGSMGSWLGGLPHVREAAETEAAAQPGARRMPPDGWHDSRGGGR